MKSKITTILRFLFTVIALTSQAYNVNAIEFTITSAGGTAKITKSATMTEPNKNNPCNYQIETPQNIKEKIIDISLNEGVFPKFSLAIAQHESAFGQNLYSKKNGTILAYGVMQLLPETAKRYGVNICDHSQNIRGGIRYLKWLFEEFQNPILVAAAYNAGEGRIYQYSGIPPFPETIKFTTNVINSYLGYGSLSRKTNQITEDKSLKKLVKFDNSSFQMINNSNLNSDIQHFE